MKDKFKIIIKSRAHCEAVQKAMFRNGIMWRGSETSLQNLDSKYLYRDGKYLTFTSSKSYGDNDTKFDLVTIDYLYEDEYTFKERTISLNSSYKATIKERELSVGCQVFSNEDVDRFIRVYQESHKK